MTDSAQTENTPSQMHPQKILQVLRAPVGGLFRHVCDLTKGLHAQGHAVGIVVDATANDDLTEQKLSDLATYASLGISRIAMPRQIGKNDFSATRHVMQRIRETDATIVHGHGAKGGAYARLAASFLKKGERPKTVYTPHGGSLHYSALSPAGLVFLTLEKILAHTTDAFIFESNFSRETFARKVTEKRGRMNVIHNGLTDEDFAPLPAAMMDYDFLFVGELRTLKGVDLLLEALSTITKPDGTPATALIVGAGPDAHQFKEQAQTLGLGATTDFPGAMPARDVFPRARTILIPSRKESFPYIVLESAAAGLSMIATDVGGIAEICGPTAHALIAPDNGEALKQAMQHALDHPKDLTLLANERKAYVSEHFRLAGMCKSISELYARLNAS